MSSNILKRIWIPVVVIMSLILASCNGTQSPTPVAANDLLSKILARGTIVISVDPDYAPQSKLLAGVKRAENTKCASNESTANQLEGFDVATAVEIAKRLKVEACFVTPQWSQITAGNWDGRWDISIGSMTITEERLKALYFSQPYYATPATFFINQSNTSFSKPEDLSGKRIGVCTGCAYEDYLRRKLVMPANPVKYTVKDPQIVGYQVDSPALADLAAGNVDAVLTSQPTGLQAVKGGLAVKQLGDPVFFEYLAAATDKGSNQDSLSLIIRVTEIIRQMHADGTLKGLSEHYYGMDYATVAGKFDIQPLGQIP